MWVVSGVLLETEREEEMERRSSIASVDSPASPPVRK